MADGVLAASDDLRPNAAVLAAGTALVALVSFGSLPVSWALASTILGVLTIAGAEVDARTHLLPDLVTGGALATGLLAAAALDPFEPLSALAGAVGRATFAAAALAALRWAYVRFRGVEGVGLGDVKLMAGIGAWLPLDALPLCLFLAAGGALLGVGAMRLAGRPVDRMTCIPFGAFLCPALWLVFFGTALAGS